MLNNNVYVFLPLYSLIKVLGHFHLLLLNIKRCYSILYHYLFFCLCQDMCKLTTLRDFAK